MYAVLETGSKQYRVATGDTLEIERVPAEAGQVVTFDRVLLVNRDGQISVGSPTVAGASVVGTGSVAGTRPAPSDLRIRRMEITARRTMDNCSLI